MYVKQEMVQVDLPYVVREKELKILKNIHIVAHGNSLRALVKHLEDISEQEIVQLEIATGVPIIYKFSNGSYTKQ